MIALKINELGNFMSKLLSSDCFDSFLLAEASIETSVSWHIDGHLNQDFYDVDTWNDPDERPYDMIAWTEIRPHCHELIKGKKAPLSFKFVLHLKPSIIGKVLEKADVDVLPSLIRALLVTIRYDGSELTMITGTSTTTFVMDKSVDSLWDQTVMRFLSGKEISYDVL